MLGSFSYVDKTGMQRTVSYTEVIFKRKYCYFVDSLTGGVFALGLSKASKTLIERFKFEIYLLIRENFHSHQFSLQGLVNIFGSNLIFKELETKRQTMLTQSLRSLVANAQEEGVHKGYFYDISVGFLKIKGITNNGKGHITLQTEHYLVDITVSDTIFSYDLPTKDYISNDLVNMLTYGIFVQNVPSIVTLEELCLPHNTRLNIPFTLDIQLEEVKQL